MSVEAKNLEDLLESIITFVRNNATSPSKLWKFLDNVENDLPESIEGPTNLQKLRASRRKVDGLEKQVHRLRQLLAMHMSTPGEQPEDKMLKAIRDGLKTVSGQRGLIREVDIPKAAKSVLESLVAQWDNSKKDSS